MSIVISDQPYADWLAESLGYLESRNIQKLALVGIDEQHHEVVTGYFDCTFADKAVTLHPMFRRTLCLILYWPTLIGLSSKRRK